MSRTVELVLDEDCNGNDCWYVNSIMQDDEVPFKYQITQILKDNKIMFSLAESDEEILGDHELEFDSLEECISVIEFDELAWKIEAGI